MTSLKRHLSAKPCLLGYRLDPGYNQRMTDIQAALGSSQMDRAENMNLERRKIAIRYQEVLQSLDWLHSPSSRKGFEHGYQSYPYIFSTLPASEKNIENNISIYSACLCFVRNI